MSYTDVIHDIENLAHFREYECKNCGFKQRAFVLVINKECERCGSRGKLRRYASLSSEIEDVIDTVLLWLGKGEDFEQAMEWKRHIDSE